MANANPNVPNTGTSPKKLSTLGSIRKAMTSGLQTVLSKKPSLTKDNLPEVADLLVELIHESQPPVKTLTEEGTGVTRPDRSESALQILLGWDLMIKRGRMVEVDSNNGIVPSTFSPTEFLQQMSSGMAETGDDTWLKDVESCFLSATDSFRPLMLANIRIFTQHRDDKPGGYFLELARSESEGRSVSRSKEREGDENDWSDVMVDRRPTNTINSDDSSEEPRDRPVMRLRAESQNDTRLGSGKVSFMDKSREESRGRTQGRNSMRRRLTSLGPGGRSLSKDTTSHERTSRSRSPSGSRKPHNPPSSYDQHFSSPKWITDDQRVYLANSTVLHCAALLGSVSFLAWAVKEPSLAPLLVVRDDKGMTPLALAAKCQADLLKPIFSQHDDHHGHHRSERLSESEKELTMSMARRYLSVVDLLRTAQPAAIQRPAFNPSDAVTQKFMDGLALCIAHDGATSLRDTRRTRRIPTTSAITSSSAQDQLRQLNVLLNTGSIDKKSPAKGEEYSDVSPHLKLYKLLVFFESKIQDRQMVLCGSTDVFYSKSMYLACGWAMQGVKRCKIMVPLAMDGLQSMLHALKFTSTLLVLDLSTIGLTGRVPNNIADIETLTYLDLKQNNLTGEIPSALGSMPDLKGISLGSNHFYGTVPGELMERDTSRSLRMLSVYDNFLSGALPTAMFDTDLAELWLNNNSIQMVIPPEIGRMNKLVSLVLSNNSFFGAIPEEICGLECLETLYLQNNDLIGQLPDGLFSLSRLQDLSLRKNSLTGQIPEIVSQLTALKTLNLGENKLSGPVPESLGRLSRLENLYLHANDFSGSVPLTLCDLGNLKQAHFHRNDRIKFKSRTSKQLARGVREAKTKLMLKGRSPKGAVNNPRRAPKVRVTFITLDPNAELVDWAEQFRV